MSKEYLFSYYEYMEVTKQTASLVSYEVRVSLSCDYRDNGKNSCDWSGVGAA